MSTASRPLLDAQDKRILQQALDDGTCSRRQEHEKTRLALTNFINASRAARGSRAVTEKQVYLWINNNETRTPSESLEGRIQMLKKYQAKVKELKAQIAEMRKNNNDDSMQSQQEEDDEDSDAGSDNNSGEAHDPEDEENNSGDESMEESDSSEDSESR